MEKGRSVGLKPNRNTRGKKSNGEKRTRPGAEKYPEVLDSKKARHKNRIVIVQKDQPTTRVRGRRVRRQANQEFLEALKQLQTLPENEIRDILNDPETKALLNKFNDIANETPAFEPVSLKEIRAQYKCYPKKQKITVNGIMTHLKEQLGDYLTAFGASGDAIYLDQLRKIEPRTPEMYDKLKYEHKKDPNIPRLPDLVPKKSVRITKEVATLPLQDPKQATRLYVAKMRRTNH